MENSQNTEEEQLIIEGRNPVREAFRAGRTIDRLYVQDGLKDGPVIVTFVSKERLDEMSETGKHQGVVAQCAAYAYAEVEDLLERAREKGEAPFLFLLDDIEDPHNLGAIIRSANLMGAHGVIIPKRRAVGLTATVAKASAGHHSEEKGGRADGNRCQGFGRCTQLHTRRTGCESFTDH